MTIGTKRLILKPLTKAGPQQVRWLNDKDITLYSEQRHRQHTLSSQLRYVQGFAGRSRIWSINVLETGDHIGNLTASVDEPNNVADVGILIGERRAWGKGFGAEAWIAACDWLLDENGGALRKLEAGCMRANEAMMRIMAKSKFRLEGERANHFLLNGSPVGMALFGRFR